MSDSIVEKLENSTKETIGNTPRILTPDPDGPTKNPVSSSLASKWPWWASLLVGAVLLYFYVKFRWDLWDFVTSKSEAEEKDDYQQLLDIVGSADTLITLVIGAIFGVGASQGLGNAVAKKNGDIAKENAKAERKSRQQAKQNQDAALGALKVADELSTALNSVATMRQHDSSRFLAQIGVGTDALTLDDLQPVDLQVVDLAATAQRAVGDLKDKIVWGQPGARATEASAT